MFCLVAIYFNPRITMKMTTSLLHERMQHSQLPGVSAPTSCWNPCNSVGTLRLHSLRMPATKPSFCWAITDYVRVCCISIASTPHRCDSGVDFKRLFTATLRPDSSPSTLTINQLRAFRLYMQSLRLANAPNSRLSPTQCVCMQYCKIIMQIEKKLWHKVFTIIIIYYWIIKRK